MSARLRGEARTTSGTSGDATGIARRPGTVGRIARGAGAVIEWVAFWIAALCPVVAVPLYAALQYTTFDPAVVVGIGIVNALALVIGHDHDPGLLGSDGSR